ncbi:hypothetical protein BDP27DRAFT_1432479 [Rhodocollybia butyracea]|uniref:Uncharacterized protein n=1 Tax=Rhodocollybia butyracea TaxID=206335 RepID=A0A9P5TXU5_9AGAR|nr:hypothetical protein BDP27DRAFT_1432479 [Rhodocollybia butyracea]
MANDDDDPYASLGLSPELGREGNEGRGERSHHKQNKSRFSDLDSRTNSQDKTSKAFQQKPRRGDQPEADGSSDLPMNTKPSSNGGNPSPTNSRSISANGTASPTSIVTANATRPRKRLEPHYSKNYIPSRVPYANTPTNNNTTSGTNMNGGWNGGGDPNDLLSPFPWRFLTAEIPERGKRQSGKTPGEKKGMKDRDRNQPTSPVTANASSPVSAASVNELFFGDEGEYWRVLRRRWSRAGGKGAGVGKAKAAQALNVKGPVKKEDDLDVGVVE